MSTAQRALVPALAVAIVTLAVWLAGIRGPYHFDDAITPVSDPASASLGAWVNHLPETLRPLTKLTYAIEGSLGLDDDPPARRAVSVVIHATSAALLCLLVLALVPAIGRVGAAAIALLWAVHPVHADAVLAVSGRSAALAGLLVIAAVLAHVRDRPWLAAVLLLFAGLARETAIAAILVIIAIELASSNRSWRRLLPAALATIVVAVWLVATPRVRELADYSFHARPVLASARDQLAAVPVGLGLYARTWALSIDHGNVLASWMVVLGGALVVAATTGAVVFAWRRQLVVAVGLALWLAAILATQSIVPKLDPLTERPLSLALAGLVIVLAAVAIRWRRIVLGLIAPVTVALAIATLHRGQLYRSDLLLWADAAAKSVTNARPHMNYGLLLHVDHRDVEALREVETAHAIDPFDPHITSIRDALAQEAP